MRSETIELDPEAKRSLRVARAALVVGVVLFVGVGVWARSKFLEPELRHRGAQRIRSRMVPVLHPGDILFQVSRSRQSKAIAKATGSEWTHCGLVFFRRGAWQVLEASSTVRWTPLSEWIGRGEGLRVEVRRADSLGAGSDTAWRTHLEQEGAKFLGKPYDVVFGWSDSAIYCSELVWKAYRASGIDLGGVQKLNDLDLTSAEAKDLVDARSGRGIRWQDSLVTPEALRRSTRLRIVTF